MTAQLERTDDAAGAAALFGVAGLALLAGTILLTVGLLRARVVSAWAAAGLTAGIVLNIVAFSAASGLLVGVRALLLVAMGRTGGAITGPAPRREARPSCA